MGTTSINDGIKKELERISGLVDDDDFEKAKQAITKLTAKLGEDHPELIRLRALIAFVTHKK